MALDIFWTPLANLCFNKLQLFVFHPAPDVHLPSQLWILYFPKVCLPFCQSFSLPWTDSANDSLSHISSCSVQWTEGVSDKFLRASYLFRRLRSLLKFKVVVLDIFVCNQYGPNVQKVAGPWQIKWWRQKNNNEIR